MPHESALPALLESLLRRLPPLPEIAMKHAVFEEALQPLEAHDVGWVLSQCIRGNLQGRPGYDEAMFVAMLWLQKLHRAQDTDTLKSLFLAAHARGWDDVLFLCRAPPPHSTLAKGARLPQVRLPLGRDPSLGERRTIASSGHRKLLERLLMDPNPLVLSKLLKNPQLQPKDVVQIASRRPTTPTLLAEVTAHPQWLAHHVVREALALNPFIPTALALTLLPTLEAGLIVRISYASDLHPTPAPICHHAAPPARDLPA